MYELICPECQTANSVTPSKAGAEIACTECNHSISVPKLGELKRLPLIDGDAATARGQSGPIGLAGGRSMAFAALAVVSLLCFLGAAFCTVNWMTIEVPMTTESHISQLQQMYDVASSARLIREYEDITKYGVDIPQPYPYRLIELNKQAWGNKSVSFAGAGLLAAAVSVVVGRRRN